MPRDLDWITTLLAIERQVKEGFNFVRKLTRRKCMGVERAFSEDTRLPGLIKLRRLTGSLTRWLNQLINLA